MEFGAFKPLHLTPHQTTLGLRALKAVALADGRFEEHERKLLQATANALGIADLDAEALTPITPEALSEDVDDMELALRLVQAMIVLALIDGEITQPEIAAIKAFAMALDVSEPRITSMRHAMKGHLTLLQYDVFRRGWMGQLLKDTWHESGVRGVWRLLRGLNKKHVDHALAWRFRQLGLLPEGTLGRQYWVHMTERRFGFPGEVDALPPQLVRHDLCHVLGGYGTDLQGEIGVVSFVSGFLRHDPFMYLFAVAVHAHLGLEVFKGDPTDTMLLDPEYVLAHVRRGMQVSHDLYDREWDYWPLMELPIDEVRQQLNILPVG